MSNVGRPRTGMPACKHCGSTDRDSNGQCACRNAAYRAARKARLAEQATKATKATKAAKPSKKTAKVKAEATVEAPEVAPKPRKRASGMTPARRTRKAEATETPVVEAPAHEVVGNDEDGFSCTCGFEGKRTIHSLRSHVSRAAKDADLL